MNEQQKAMLDLKCGPVDSGGNRKFDYISLQRYDAAGESQVAKENFDDLTDDELVYLRGRLKDLGLRADLVFEDRLALIRCLLFWVKHARDQEDKCEAGLALVHALTRIEPEQNTTTARTMRLIAREALAKYRKVFQDGK